MNKELLKQYTDACELVRETEYEIRKLESKKKKLAQTSVKGSSPEYPYTEKHYHISGTVYTYEDSKAIERERQLLNERKTAAEQIKIKVEEYINTLNPRMQRIITYRYIKNMSWDEVAKKMKGKCTAESLRAEFKRLIAEDSIDK